MVERRSPSDELAEIAGFLRTAPDRVAERLAGLALGEQMRLALALPAKERLELLLHAPKPLALVRSLPDSTLYLTLRELGPTDALPLLALASAEQLHHVLDLESWRRDRYDGKRAGAWVALLLEAGEPALRRFLRAADDESLALLFQRWMRVRPIEPEGHGHEIHVLAQTETGHEQGLVSPDGAYLISPLIPEHAGALQRLARLFYREDTERYLRVMWSAVAELPSDLEEQALRWRQSRLEEHGFPPWEEAITVYAPPAARPLPRPATAPAAGAEAAGLAPRLGESDPLAEALRDLAPRSRERILGEALSVANRLLVADGADTGDPAAHRHALRQAAGYVAIALEARRGEEPAPDRALLEETPVLELFREGYARAVELQARAHALVHHGWAASHSRALDLLEPRAGAAIRGLLEPRPLHAAPDGSLRPFRSVGEIEQARIVLETAELVGRLLVSRFGLDVAGALAGCEAARSEPPRFSTFLLTLLAWNSARSRPCGDPLPPDVVADFLRDVASRRTAPADAPLRALDALADRLTRAAALAPHEVALLRAFGEDCLERLAAECGALDPGVPVDPRFVTSLLLESEGS